MALDKGDTEEFKQLRKKIVVLSQTLTKRLCASKIKEVFFIGFFYFAFRPGKSHGWYQLLDLDQSLAFH